MPVHTPFLSPISPQSAGHAVTCFLCRGFVYHRCSTPSMIHPPFTALNCPPTTNEDLSLNSMANDPPTRVKDAVPMATDKPQIASSNVAISLLVYWLPSGVDILSQNQRGEYNGHFVHCNLSCHYTVYQKLHDIQMLRIGRKILTYIYSI